MPAVAPEPLLLPARVLDLLRQSDDAELRGDLDRAIDFARRATLAPEADAEVWWRLATLLNDCGRVDGLTSALDGVLDRDPSHAGAWGLRVSMAETESDRIQLRLRVEASRARGLPDADASRWLRRLASLPVKPGRSEADRADLDPLPPVGGGGAHGDVSSDLVPADVDLLRYLSVFSGREDVYARQWWSPAKGRGGYSPVYEPLTPGALRRHFLGSQTVGIYLLRHDGTCNVFVVDLDVVGPAVEAAPRDPVLARQVQRELDTLTALIRQRLRELGLPPVVESSGFKGRHLWVLLDQPVPAAELHELGIRLRADIRRRHDCAYIDIETFPKQAERRADGLGNLVKLPLGVHQRSGRRSQLLDDNFNPISRPFQWLRTVPRAPATKPAEALAILPEASGDARTVAFDIPAPVDPGRPPLPPWGQPVTPSALPTPKLPGRFTEADVRRSDDVSCLTSRCGVLGQLVDDALQCRPLSRSAWLAVKYTVGNLDDGVKVFNFLLERAKGPSEEALKSVLRGQTTSCQRLCARAGEAASKCTACEFPWAKESYPTPVLHLADPKRPAPKARPATTDDALEATVRELGRSLQHLVALERECRTALSQLTERLSRRPDAALTLPEGVISVRRDDTGRATLVFAPEGAPPRTVALVEGVLAVGQLELPTPAEKST